MMLPPSLEELVSKDHPVRILNEVINSINLSRKLSGVCRKSIYFMWLSAMNHPDHNTINRFPGVRLKEALGKIFEQVIQLLANEGLLSIDEVYTDGTKIEANANKYTFVRKKSIQSNKEKMKKQLEDSGPMPRA